jgi:electron-transferring-flavoprotein dehydrogenase
MADARPFIPARHQAPFPAERFLADAARPEGVDEVPVDVLFVGGGPAGLAGAIALAQMVRDEPEGPLAGLRIAVLEKASSLGEHCLSGAVINPRSLLELFPGLSAADLPFRGEVRAERLLYLTRDGAHRLPMPRSMCNRGNHVASLCEVVRWMGAKAEELGVMVLTGFAADKLLMRDGVVAGVRTAPAGLGRDGTPGDAYQAPADVTARVTVLAEGTRGPLAQAYFASRGVRSPNPQLFALGVKELWRAPRALEGVIHTMGWPLPASAFGGAFIYPMGENLVSLGVVVGLDYGEQALDVHELTQRLKTHPAIRPIIDGGELLEWGAKTIPEGGLYSLPERLHGDGVIVVGDAAGLVNVAALKGVHYAVQSGVFAARAAADAVRKDDASAAVLGRYDQMLRSSFVWEDLHGTRNMRLGFTRGRLAGAAIAGLAEVTRGRLPAGRIGVHADAERARRGGPAGAFVPDNRLTFSKVNANFKSGNQTRDDIPLHVIQGEGVTPEAARFYAALCPAGVYEERGGGLVVNAPNCIDCKATDVLGPRWTAREGGSGPRYKLM